MLTIPQINNLKVAAAQAVTCERLTGVPAEITIAQWALESGWGAHSPNNNCFGIKDYTGAYDKQLLHTYEFFKNDLDKELWVKAKEGRTAILADATPGPTQRYFCQDWFATFPTLTDCFIKHAQLFQTNRYKIWMDHYKDNHDLITFIRGIAPIYATDPDYERKLISLISERMVVDALQDARSFQTQ